MLFLSQTPMSVPALMGTLMCIGLTTANSILVVSFANQRMAAGDDPLRAATSAGYTRLRPVLMTAGAMILGMVPMALGIGEGGEQNAPLGQGGDRRPAVRDVCDADFRAHHVSITAPPTGAA